MITAAVHSTSVQYPVMIIHQSTETFQLFLGKCIRQGVQTCVIQDLSYIGQHNAFVS